MPEMLIPTSAVMGAGLGKEVALLADGRFLEVHMDTSSGTCPETQGLMENGDLITIDIKKRKIDVQLTDAEL